MRRFFDVWKAGMITLIPLLIVFYILKSVFNIVQTLALSFFDGNGWNWAISFGVWFVAVPLVCGLLLSWQWFRDLGLALLGRIPGIKILAKFIFKRRQKLGKKERERRAVRVEVPPGSSCWFTGAVVREWQGPANPRDANSEQIVWCKVMLWTFPVSVTGYALDVPKNSIVFTDMTVEEALLDAAGFYLSSNDDEAKQE